MKNVHNYTYGKKSAEFFFFIFHLKIYKWNFSYYPYVDYVVVVVVMTYVNFDSHVDHSVSLWMKIQEILTLVGLKVMYTFFYAIKLWNELHFCSHLETHYVLEFQRQWKMEKVKWNSKVELEKSKKKKRRTRRYAANATLITSLTWIMNAHCKVGRYAVLFCLFSLTGFFLFRWEVWKNVHFCRDN